MRILITSTLQQKVISNRFFVFASAVLSENSRCRGRQNERVRLKRRVKRGRGCARNDDARPMFGVYGACAKSRNRRVDTFRSKLLHNSLVSDGDAAVAFSRWCGCGHGVQGQQWRTAFLCTRRLLLSFLQCCTMRTCDRIAVSRINWQFSFSFWL